MAQRTKITALIAGALLLTSACQSTGGSTGGSGGGSSSGGGTNGGAPQQGRSVPAEAKGKCGIGPHSIEAVSTPVGKQVIGTLDWLCEGSVLMQLNIRLVYLGNNADNEHEVDEGSPLNVDNLTSPKPAKLTAPCTSGLWKMKVVGQITGVNSAPLILNTNDRYVPPFNTPDWLTPTTIKC